MEFTPVLLGGLGAVVYVRGGRQDFVVPIFALYQRKRRLLRLFSMRVRSSSRRNNDA